MATLDELKDSIYDWLDSVTPANTPIDWEDEDDADRKRTRFSLRLRQDTASPHSQSDQTLDSETITEHVTFTLVVTGWGKNSEALAKLSRASLYSSKRFGFNALWKYVGLGQVSPVLNLSELESAQIDARYEFRVTLHTILEYVFGADYAETISVTVKENRLGTVIDNQVMGDNPHPIPEGC